MADRMRVLANRMYELASIVAPKGASWDEGR
jgi:hypothetical protein